MILINHIKMDNTNDITSSEDNLYELLLCSKCGKISEILKIHTDNSKLELNCKYCGEYEILIDDYCSHLSKENYFKKCSSCENKGINNKYYYCFKCVKDICEECKNKNHSDHDYIEADEKKNTCIKHKKEFQYFCEDDQENFCEIKDHKEHDNHKIIKISNIHKFFLENQGKFNQLIEDLKKIMKFNEIILNKAEKYQNEDFYVKSINNMGKSLKEGNERNSKDIKCFFAGLSDDIKNSLEAIEFLQKKHAGKKIEFSRNKKNLPFNSKELDDDDLKYISQIRFNQLKEIDISENKIKNIQPFKKMRLPFLEFLNLSHNEIEIVEPVTKLKSEKLQYIFLQNNKIKDINTFSDSDSDFPNLEILRAEDNFNLEIENNDDEETKENKKKIKVALEKIKGKYPKRFIYDSIDKQNENFKKEYKYDSDISCDIDSIDLCDLKGGDQMLKDLFLIITYKSKNKIKKLILRNNDIKDPSILKRVNFNKLKVLDLAVNEIKNLTFLLEMKAENLEYLYLDNNKIKEVYQILNSKFPNLEILSLNENQFELDEMEDTQIYAKLNNKKIENKNNPKNGQTIHIQWEKEVVKKRNDNSEEQNS